MQSYAHAFELKELLPSLNVFMRWHYRKRASEFKRIEKLCSLLIVRPPSPLTKYHITFTRHTQKPLDIDNLVASFKPVMDAIVRAGVIEDDKWCTFENVSYRQVRAEKKTDQKTSVSIQELISKEFQNTEVQ